MSITFPNGVYSATANFFSMDPSDITKNSDGSVTYTPPGGNFVQYDPSTPTGALDTASNYIGITFNYQNNTATFTAVSQQTGSVGTPFTVDMADFQTTPNPANYSNYTDPSENSLVTNQYLQFYPNNDVLAFQNSSTGQYFFLSGSSNLTSPVTFLPTQGATSDSYPDHSNYTIPELTSYQVPCFLRGTPLLTVKGAKSVEDLKVGDLLVTLPRQEWRGRSQRQRTLRRIIWIGRRCFYADWHSRPERVYPIRITANAVGPKIPMRDVLLSPDHSIYIDGQLIPAQYLANGLTIYQDRSIPFVEYYHIEVEHHSIASAAGLLVETYLDTGNRDVFGAVLDGEPKTWGAHACAPLVLDRAAIEPFRRALEGTDEFTRLHEERACYKTGHRLLAAYAT